MKAFQLMVFMMLFNFSIFMIGALHIYNMGESYDPSQASNDYDLDQYSQAEERKALWESSFFGTILWWIFGAIATATVVSYFTKGKSVDGVIYAAFGGTYLAVTKTAYDTMSAVLPTENYAVSLLLSVYVIMLVLLFIIGLFQLVRGGMKYYI